MTSTFCKKCFANRFCTLVALFGKTTFFFLFPTTNGGMQNWSSVGILYTLHTRFSTFGNDLCDQSVLINKITASELSRKSVKSALLVGFLFRSWLPGTFWFFPPFVWWWQPLPIRSWKERGWRCSKRNAFPRLFFTWLVVPTGEISGQASQSNLRLFAKNRNEAWVLFKGTWERLQLFPKLGSSRISGSAALLAPPPPSPSLLHSSPLSAWCMVYVHTRFWELQSVAKY